MERRAEMFRPLDHRVCRLGDARHEGRVFEQRSLEEVLEHLCRQDMLCVRYVAHGDLEQDTVHSARGELKGAPGEREELCTPR